MPTLTSNQLEFDVADTQEGIPLILIMGFTSQRISWPQPFLDALCDRGLRTITFDNRDVGKSTWLQDQKAPPFPSMMTRRMAGRPINAPYGLEDMADDAAGILDALDLKSAHVLGISMGGMIAQTFALRLPGRTRSLISLMSAPGARRHFLSGPRALKAMLTKPERNDREAYIENGHKVARAFCGGRFAIDFDRVDEIYGQTWDRGLNRQAPLRHLAAILASGDRSHRLLALGCPTLVIHGDSDPLIPVAAGRKTAKLIPHADYLEIGGLGHELPREIWPTLANAVASHVLFAESQWKKP
jgi:pimeloyl-ACP methyl ester carboxylesterase